MTQFSTIVADPPWQYDKSGDHLRNRFDARPNSNQADSNTASSHARYGSMSLAELKALPVADHATDNAHLYLWTTNSFMGEAIELMAAWGFKKKTILTWVQMRGETAEPSPRMGYYFRSATEHVIFGVRGTLPLLTGHQVVGNVIMTPRRLKHSLKPAELQDMAERCSPGPYLEMFARSPRPGWSSWGNEFENDIEFAHASMGLPPTGENDG